MEKRLDGDRMWWNPDRIWKMLKFWPSKYESLKSECWDLRRRIMTDFCICWVQMRGWPGPLSLSACNPSPFSPSPHSTPWSWDSLLQHFIYSICVKKRKCFDNKSKKTIKLVHIFLHMFRNIRPYIRVNIFWFIFLFPWTSKQTAEQAMHK